MIIYQETKARFLHHAFEDDIEDVILKHYKASVGGGVAKPMINSWANSLMEMAKVLKDDEIPDDAGIAIEYQLPQSSKRIDFIITGEDEEAQDLTRDGPRWWTLFRRSLGRARPMAFWPRRRQRRAVALAYSSC